MLDNNIKKGMLSKFDDPELNLSLFKRKIDNKVNSILTLLLVWHFNYLDQAIRH